MKTNNLNKKSSRVFFYQIDGVYTYFSSLYDAKKYFFFYSPQEIIKNFAPSTCIIGFNYNGDAISYTDVIIDEKGNYRFSKTSKICATLQY